MCTAVQKEVLTDKAKRPEYQKLFDLSHVLLIIWGLSEVVRCGHPANIGAALEICLLFQWCKSQTLPSEGHQAVWLTLLKDTLVLPEITQTIQIKQTLQQWSHYGTLQRLPTLRLKYSVNTMA